MQAARARLDRSAADIAGFRKELECLKVADEEKKRKLARTQKDLARTEKDLARTEKELARTQKDLTRTQKELSAVRGKLDATRKKLEALRASKAYRIGTALASPIRKSRDILKALSEHD